MSERKTTSRSRIGGAGGSLTVVDGISSSGSVQIGRVQPQSPGHRTVFCNDRESNYLAKYLGNQVSTTKYNLFTFLPKGLYEQFRRVANLYFLTISCLSFTPVSPVSPITNVIPLSIVLFVSLVKEAFEDWKRLQNDMTINNSPVDLLQDQKWESVPWKTLQVGDIIRVKQDGFFPADLVFLATTIPDGVCYTEDMLPEYIQMLMAESILFAGKAIRVLRNPSSAFCSVDARHKKLMGMNYSHNQRLIRLNQCLQILRFLF